MQRIRYNDLSTQPDAVMHMRSELANTPRGCTVLSERSQLHATKRYASCSHVFLQTLHCRGAPAALSRFTWSVMMETCHSDQLAGMNWGAPSGCRWCRHSVQGPAGPSASMDVGLELHTILCRIQKTIAEWRCLVFDVLHCVSGAGAQRERCRVVQGCHDRECGRSGGQHRT